MPSIAFQTWSVQRLADLDEIEDTHRVLRGTVPRRRIATQLINQAYTVFLFSQFQAYCRDLHTESALSLVATIIPEDLKKTVLSILLGGRKLDQGNANPSNLGADFNRFGVSFWRLVTADNPQNDVRKKALEELNVWRNAIAHHNYSPAMLRGGRVHLTIARVKEWRRACDGLARSFDKVIRDRIVAATDTIPW